METLSKTHAADAKRDKVQGLPPPAPPASGGVSDSLSVPSFKDYPVHRPFINTHVHDKSQTHTHQSWLSSSPSKAFPETNSAAILSALKNLQEKMRRLELGKGHAPLSLDSMRRRASQTNPESDKVIERPINDQSGSKREPSGQPNSDEASMTPLAAAESRCVRLDQQLDHVRRMLHNVKADRMCLVKEQISMETAKSANKQSDTVCKHAQLKKLERLEQEYLRLTCIQNEAEMKIRQLEIKLQEEEHQRKLVQEKADQLQTGLEANRILLQSVSLHMSSRETKEGKSELKVKTVTEKSSQQQSSFTQPHYKLRLKDLPFVVGTSVGCSHSVRANVQSVLSLLKQHQPQLCNSTNDYGVGRRRHSDTSSSSSSASGEELSELLETLREELRHMCSEQDELLKQLEASISDQQRKELHREQERLLLKMERKGEQISKLYRYKTQIRKLRKEANRRPKSGNEVTVTSTVSTRARSDGSVTCRQGDRRKRNLRLLRDMKALQTSLRI